MIIKRMHPALRLFGAEKAQECIVAIEIWENVLKYCRLNNVLFVWIYTSFKCNCLHPICQAWKTLVMIGLKIPFAEFGILCKHQCLDM